MIHNQESAKQYIKDKKLIQLSQALATSIAFSKPEDPVQFLIKLLSDLKATRESGGSPLVCFTNDDIKAMFVVYDPFNKGKVTKEQVEGALVNFGVDSEIIPQVLGENPNQFDIEEFSKVINEGVRLTLFSE